MDESNKSQRSKSVNNTDGNQSDKLRFTLLEETCKTLGLTEFSKIVDRLLTAQPTEFKLLLDEGLMALSNPFYSRILSTTIDVHAAICLGALYAKFPTEGTKEATKVAALQTYLNSEREVKRFDENLDELTKTPVFKRVRRELRKLLNGFQLSDVIDSLRFGPGVTSTPGIKLASHKLAYLQRNEGSIPLHEGLYDLLAENGALNKAAVNMSSLVSDFVHLGQTNYLPPRCSKNMDPFVEVIKTVPKDALTDRTISTLPLTVTLFGIGANKVLSDVIHMNDSRVEFNYQHRCSDHLIDGLNDGQRTTATLDLKDASGHISWALLERVIDNQDVLEFLRAVRAPVSLIELRLRKKKRKAAVVPEPIDSTTWASRFLYLPMEVQPDVITWDDVCEIYPWVKNYPELDYEIISSSAKVNLTLAKRSHAGMGSGTTFPIMSALIAAILKSSFNGDFRVFGDDIVLTRTSEHEVQSVIKTLQLFGYVINNKKSCYGTKPLRECVGSWLITEEAYTTQFTPLYLREDLTSLVSPKKRSIPSKKDKTVLVTVPGRCDDLRVLHYAVKWINCARILKHSIHTKMVTWILQNSEVPISFVPEESGLFGIEVPKSTFWSFFSPHFNKVSGKLDGVRCIIPELGKTATSVIPIRVDAALQLYYLKINSIGVGIFKDTSPSAYVDLDVIRIKRLFTPDSFVGPLMLHQCDPKLLVKQFVDAGLPLDYSAEIELGDRPEDDKASYFQASQRLEVPPEIILRWEAKDHLSHA